METDGGSVLPSARKFGHATASDNNTRPSWAIWLSRLLQRARTHRSALLKWSITLVACCVVLHSVTSSIGSLLLQRARNKARSQQQLVGFSTARLEHLPDNIKSEQLGEPQLLAHPLLTKVKTPSCRLNTYQEDRYAPLEPAYGAGPRGARAHYLPRHRLKYFVALNLYDSEKVLPSLIKVIHSALVALGPSRFHVSIFENGSKDDTPAQLVLLAQLLKRIGAGYTIVSDPLRQAGFQAHHRIETLAELRNLALKPLFEAPKGTYDRVIFINDVHFCEADLYEIMLQNEVQDADMSCGMDYQELKIPEFKASGYPLLFYDVWVARDMLGLPFYNIKWPTGDWELPTPVMPLSPSRVRLQNLLPIQVFSCWNGLTIFDAALFEPPTNLRFRSKNGLDTHSECYLFCSDIWKDKSPLNIDGTPRPGKRGARIQVVPRTSVGYAPGEYEKARQDRNTTAFEVDGLRLERVLDQEMVKWEVWPPKLIQNYPSAVWSNQQLEPPF